MKKTLVAVIAAATLSLVAALFAAPAASAAGAGAPYAADAPAAMLGSIDWP
ncbi:hypothetical protein GCM10010193_14900 [Kitasatospora atroaurantiaca]|uniref:Uncharacterized protein n=1 Tax=Kitasatospora atroaurantiaca TaxID=285545 RepID=A0A561EID4_9ACTN|nr:hypothetical protein [Kitasatospora atroaurantiaca]TWE15378.1 hypothetical protein FB465_0271 [Kitasatospora atroaurantiaca]